MSKLDLIDDDEQITDLKVNKEYAKKYEHIQKMKDLQRAKEMEDSEEDTSEEEDSDAEFLNDELDSQMINLLAKIKTKDPSIYDKNEKFYDDKPVEVILKEKEEKKLTYKDLVRERAKKGVEELIEDSDVDENELAPVHLQAKLKKAVLTGLKGVDSDDEDDFMNMKKKSAAEESAEKQAHDEFKKTYKPKVDVEAPLSRYFGDDSKLSEDDKFLKEFILLQGWKSEGKRSMGSGEGKAKRWDHLDHAEGLDDIDSEEDGIEVDAMEDFEHNYNFRYEQPHGTNIEGHIRGGALDSVRKRNEKRKEARERKKDREVERKTEKDAEIRRLSNIKKQELMDRLLKIRQAAGLKLNEDMEGKALDFMTSEFDAKAHDKMMQSLLGADYDAQEDEEFDPSKLAGEESKVVKKMSKVIAGADEETAKELKAISKEKQQEEEEYYGGEEEAEDEGWNEDEEKENGLWFVCDGCAEPILPGEHVYECSKGCDFALCKGCQKKTKHAHKLIRDKVPEWAAPPTDAGEQIAAVNEEEQEVIDAAAAEEDAMGYDDVVGGDFATRFKYKTVKPLDVGLTAAEILMLPDSEVARLMPMSSLAPYADLPSRKTTKKRQQHAQQLRERLQKGEFENWWESAAQKKEDKKSKKRSKAERDEEGGFASLGLEIADDEKIEAAISEVKNKRRRGQDGEAIEVNQKEEEEEEEKPRKQAKKENGSNKPSKAVKNLSDERKAAYGLADSGKMKEKVKKQITRN